MTVWKQTQVWEYTLTLPPHWPEGKRLRHVTAGERGVCWKCEERLAEWAWAAEGGHCTPCIVRSGWISQRLVSTTTEETPDA